MTIAEAARLLADLLPPVFSACRRMAGGPSGSSPRLTARQEDLLFHLRRDAPRTLKQLAELMGVTSSTMCLTLDRLEREGLVRRGRSDADRRCVEVRLTSEGARLSEDRAALDPRLAAELLERLEDEEREQALYGLWLLAQAAARSAAEKDRT